MIEVHDLKIGDILLLKDKTHNFYRHVAVVTEIDNTQSIYKVIHWIGVREPFSVTEATLPPEELLNERNIELECFRLYDQQPAEKAVGILKQWLTWGVPYSKERFNKLESTMNNFFSVTSDLLNNLPPQNCKEKFPDKLEPNRKEMETLFIQNYRDIIKYAARRDISPIRPKEDKTSQKGFHCVQGILLAFQVSYVTDFVNSVTDKCLSNKHTDTNINLNDSKPIFESAEKALNNNFQLENFLDAIPIAFKLYAKLCWVDTFRHAMLNDTENIKFLGTLLPIKKADIKPDAETMASRVQFLTEQGLFKREKLVHEVILPSAKIIL